MAKLRAMDKFNLRMMGYSKEEVNEIDKLKRYCKYFDVSTNKKLTQKETISKIGREKWLSGLGKSLYHLSCERDNIYFLNKYMLN